MRILITGDLGFVGTETKRLLTLNKEVEKMGFKSKHEVIGYDIMDGWDIRDINQLENVIKQQKIDRILHLAAIARFSDADNDPQLAFETNVVGTANIVRVAERYHIPLVYASTGSVYMPIEETPPITEKFKARGNSVYACTKYLGECSVRKHTPHIILRYAHLYGREKRGHGLVGAFLERMERGLSPLLYGGKQSNDFMYVQDTARANTLALEASWDKWNNTYNIGTGEELTTEEAAKIICEMTGYKGKIEKLGGRTVDPLRFVFDISKAERMLNFKAEYNFKQGMKEMLKDYKLVDGFQDVPKRNDATM